MHKLPSGLIASLRGAAGFHEEAFIRVHEAGTAITSVRINPGKHSGCLQELPIKSKVPWAKDGYYLTERPSFTFDPLFHSGAYYVQEASSMFIEQALQQLVDLNKPLHVLDLCAAPGGKSTHLQSLINKESVLVSNEVIRSRVTVLSENITKWGAANCIVTNNDPKDFTVLEHVFDVIVIDAPCSGSGLFRKDNEAIEEWSLQNVEHCSVRQQRIIEDAWPALKPGGVLIYSTCSYSPLEDEIITDIISDKTGAENIPLEIKEQPGIVTSYSPKHNNAAYRFYPYLLDGEGFFLACFRKKGEEDFENDLKYFSYKPDKKLIAPARNWISSTDALQLYRHEQQVFAMPGPTMQLFLNVQKKLNVRKAGVKIGDLVRDELIPDHALALSNLRNDNLPVIELNKEDAIAYLRRTDFEVNVTQKGWCMVAYKSLPLGWIKNVGNRINNYYPREWRIRN